MKADIHNPELKQVQTLKADTSHKFHVIELTDRGGGTLEVYIKNDWSDWDQIVKAIESYRSTRQQLGLNNEH